MGARGERTFQAGDKTVTVLFTNRALASAEKRMERGVVGVAQGMMDGKSGIAELVVLLQVGLEAARVDARTGARQVTMDDAYAVLDAAGFGETAKNVIEAVAAVLSYTPSSNGNGAGDGEGHDPNA